MQKRQGFTLIELLIVVTIISVLILMSVLVIRRQIAKAHDAQRRDDLHRIAVAFEEYYSDEECYPPADIITNCAGNELDPYLSSIPCDPVYRTPYCYVTDTLHPSCFKSFKLLAHFDNTDDPEIAALNCEGNDSCGYDVQCQADTGLSYSFNWGLASTNVTVINPTITASPPAPSSPPLPSSNPSTPPSPSSNPQYQYYCQGLNNCSEYDILRFNCTPNFTDPFCTGSNNCNNQLGSCTPI